MAISTINNSGFKTFQATAVAIEAFVRVAADSSGTIAVAGETDLAIGVTVEAIAASGYGTVKLWSGSGTFQVQAAGAVTAGAQLYAAAAGEVDDSGSYKARLVALTAATAQGDVIEVAMIEDATYGSGQFVSGDIGALSAAGSAQGDAGAITKVITYVASADGTKGVVLPAAAAGLMRIVYNLVATNGLKVYPASGDDINDGTSDAAITIEGKTMAVFIAIDSTTWISMYTVNT